MSVFSVSPCFYICGSLPVVNELTIELCLAGFFVRLLSLGCFSWRPSYLSSLFTADDCKPCSSCLFSKKRASLYL